MKKKYVRLLFSLLLILFLIKSAYLLNTAYTNPHNYPTLNDSALKGKQIFREKNCIACHQLYGLGGYMGPDLTNVISAPGKGRLYATAFLKMGTAKMPNMKLSDSEISSLLDYLECIDKTGESPLRNFKISSYGNIQIEDSRKRN